MNYFSETNRMPSNTDAERAIIGQTILDKHLSAPARQLSTTDFYSPFYRAVWSAFLELDEGGAEIDPIMAFDIIRQKNPPLPNTLPELVNAATGAVHGFNPNVYVQKLKNCSQRRYLIRELNAQIVNLTETEDLASVKTEIEKHFSEIDFLDSDAGGFTSLADIIDADVKPALLDLRQGVTHKISTGFAAIDSMIGGGLSLSDVLCVAGLPGSGKSAFVLQMAVGIAKQGIPTAFLSGEMSNKENGLRLISQISKSMNLNAATHISADELNFYNQWADACKNLPLYFDAKTYDLATLSNNLRALIEKKGVQVLIIDYIQLLKLTKFDKQTRYERITEAAQEVKRIAMRFGITVIEVAQFNREGAKSLKPSMHDLEGSSQLEKDVSLCFIIDRDEADQQKVTLRIVKGRNSGKCEIEGRFTGINLNFEF